MSNPTESEIMMIRNIAENETGKVDARVPVSRLSIGPCRIDALSQGELLDGLERKGLAKRSVRWCRETRREVPSVYLTIHGEIAWKRAITPSMYKEWQDRF